MNETYLFYNIREIAHAQDAHTYTCTHTRSHTYMSVYKNTKHTHIHIKMKKYSN